MRKRTRSFTEAVAAAQRPLVQGPTPRFEQHVIEPRPAIDPAIAETCAYILKPVGRVLRAGLFGLGTAMIAEALLGWRVNGFSICAAISGAALVVDTVADSETVRSWADWWAEVYFARELSKQQWERQRQAWQQVRHAAQVQQAIDSQPSSEDEVINRTVSDILMRYYEKRARNDPEIGTVKLWSRRQIAAEYGLGPQSNVTKRIQEVIEQIADGYHLKPQSYAQAFRALFGVFPGQWQDHTLVRVADNPAQGEPVFVPKIWRGEQNV